MKYLLLSIILLSVQALAPEVEITAEPDHHLTFENKSVRVFNVEVPPHSDTLMHWHRHDYLSIALGPADVVNAVKDKPPAPLKLQDGETRFAPATFAHIAHNVGDRPFRNVTIELLEDEALRTSTAHWDEDRGLDVLTKGTKQIVFVKDNVRVTEFELQPGGVIPLHHHAGPLLVVALTDYELRNDIQGKPAATVSMKTGESKWLPGGYSHTITNPGPKPAKYVTLEFP